MQIGSTWRDSGWLLCDLLTHLLNVNRKLLFAATAVKSFLLTLQTAKLHS